MYCKPRCQEIVKHSNFKIHFLGETVSNILKITDWESFFYKLNCQVASSFFLAHLILM